MSREGRRRPRGCAVSRGSPARGHPCRTPSTPRAAGRTSRRVRRARPGACGDGVWARLRAPPAGSAPTATGSPSGWSAPASAAVERCATGDAGGRAAGARGGRVRLHVRARSARLRVHDRRLPRPVQRRPDRTPTGRTGTPTPGDASWTYSARGGASRTPAPGGAEAWVFGDGSRPPSSRHRRSRGGAPRRHLRTARRATAARPHHPRPARPRPAGRRQVGRRTVGRWSSPPARTRAPDPRRGGRHRRDAATRRWRRRDGGPGDRGSPPRTADGDRDDATGTTGRDRRRRGHRRRRRIRRRRRRGRGTAADGDDVDDGRGVDGDGGEPSRPGRGRRGRGHRRASDDDRAGGRPAAGAAVAGLVAAGRRRRRRLRSRRRPTEPTPAGGLRSGPLGPSSATGRARAAAAWRPRSPASSTRARGGCGRSACATAASRTTNPLLLLLLLAVLGLRGGGAADRGAVGPGVRGVPQARGRSCSRSAPVFQVAARLRAEPGHAAVHPARGRPARLGRRDDPRWPGHRSSRSLAAVTDGLRLRDPAAVRRRGQRPGQPQAAARRRCRPRCTRSGSPSSSRITVHPAAGRVGAAHPRRPPAARTSRPRPAQLVQVAMPGARGRARPVAGAGRRDGLARLRPPRRRPGRDPARATAVAARSPGCSASASASTACSTPAVAGRRSGCRSWRSAWSPPASGCGSPAGAPSAPATGPTRGRPPSGVDRRRRVVAAAGVVLAGVRRPGRPSRRRPSPLACAAAAAGRDRRRPGRAAAGLADPAAGAATAPVRLDAPSVDAGSTADRRPDGGGTRDPISSRSA